MGKLLIIFSKIDTFNRFLTIKAVFNRIQRTSLKKEWHFHQLGRYIRQVSSSDSRFAFSTFHKSFLRKMKKNN